MSFKKDCPTLVSRGGKQSAWRTNLSVDPGTMSRRIIDLLFLWEYASVNSVLPPISGCSMATRNDGAASRSQVTELLVRWRDGDNAAVDQLILLVYGELRRLARSQLRRQGPEQSLESASLVHEAYLRVTGKNPPDWQSRAHFFGVVAHLMREILVDRVRRMRAAKRGAGARDLSLDEAIGLPHQKNVDMIRLDDALQQLAKLDERQCRIVELRFFAGLSLEETSVAMGISEATGVNPLGETDWRRHSCRSV
jgi:RNA polymerase sigma factor (TIGR02999 family)